MKKIAIYLVAGTLVGNVILSGCSSVKNANNTQKGAVIGAVGGGVLGAVIDNNVGKGGNGALGAVLGTVIGGTVGGIIGNKMDKQAREIETALPGAQVERVGEGIRLVLGENSVNFDFNWKFVPSKSKLNFPMVSFIWYSTSISKSGKPKVFSESSIM